MPLLPELFNRRIRKSSAGRKTFGTKKKYMKIEKAKKYGHLTCLKRKEPDAAPGEAVWECRCDCGRKVEVSEKLLRCGVAASCGCRRGRARDLTGKRFGRLTALEPLEERGKDGSVQWLCRCDCGREVAVRVNMLTAGRTQSCGCYQRERLGKGRRFTAGTCLEIIASEKIPKNNTSGCRGVSWSRGAWIAYINYAGKHYHLGRYPRYQDAVKVRQGAEALRLKYAKERADAEKEGSGGAMPEFGERLETLLNEIHAGIDGQAEKNPT